MFSLLVCFALVYSGTALECYSEERSGPTVVYVLTEEECGAGMDTCYTHTLKMKPEMGSVVSIRRACGRKSMCDSLCDGPDKDDSVESCKAKCCKGNLCNVEGDSTPTTIAPGLQCYVGQISNGQAIKPIKTEECPSYTDSCYTMEITQNQDDLKSVAYSCGTERMCDSFCKTDSFKDAKSCEAKCCKGNLCNAEGDSTPTTIAPGKGKEDTSSASVLAVHVATTLLLVVVAFLVAV